MSVELWVLHGPHWKLPLTIEWIGPLARIRLGGPGVRLMDQQIKVGHEFLAAMGAEQRLNTFWAVRDVLMTMASLSKETDPQVVVVWTPVPPVLEDTDDFIDGFCRDTGLVKLSLMQIIWTGLRQYALRWLLAGKPLKLGFATIHALPLRKNWIEVLRQKEKRRTNPFWNAELTGVEWVRRDRRGKRWSDTPYPTWTIHVVEGKQWDDAVRRHELGLRAKGERLGLYLLRLAERLRNGHEVVRDIYVEFNQKAQLSRFKFPPLGVVGQRKAWRRVGRDKAVVADDEISDRIISGVLKSQEQKPDASKSKGLLEVPALQPYPADVWDPKEPLPECGGRTGDGGMSVLDAVEVGGRGELLAVRPKWWQGGVGTGT